MNRAGLIPKLICNCLWVTISMCIAWSCANGFEPIREGSGHIAIEATVSNEGASWAAAASADSLHLRITCLDDSSSHEWLYLKDFNSDESLVPGTYLIELFTGDMVPEVDIEPLYYGSAQVQVAAGETADARVDCTLRSGGISIRVDIPSQLQSTDGILTINPSGGAPATYTPEQGIVSVWPGKTTIGIGWIYGTNESLRLSIGQIDVKAATLYRCTITCDLSGTAPRLTLSSDDNAFQPIWIDITDRVLSAAAPILEPLGVPDGATLHVPEGTMPTEAVGITVLPDSPDGIAALMLSSYAPNLQSAGWPSETDLLACDAATLSLMESEGLHMTRSDDGTITVNLTDVIPGLRYTLGVDHALFSLTAIDASGRESAPWTVRIVAEAVAVSIETINTVTAGMPTGQLTVDMGDGDIGGLTIETLVDGTWQPAAIIERTHISGGIWNVSYRAPEGLTDFALRTLYCGMEQQRTTVQRISPQFTITADAFARRAVIRIGCDIPELYDFIVANAGIYADGKMLPILERSIENHTITVIGLTPATKLTLSAAVGSPRGDFAAYPSATITTESEQELPNPSFEYHRPSIRHTDLPCGGAYSQNSVAIYNRQNMMTYEVDAPVDWANTNAKTFCTSRTPNTWYMQPSVSMVDRYYDGSMAVRLDCVGFDPEGEPIPEYLQQGTPYVPYSRNVPQVRYRAAGKLFLGNYSFDPTTMTETYDQGVAHSSRPMSLNGYYCFMPLNDTDCGYLSVEIISASADGTETVIAGGDYRFRTATGYTAFSIPLSYELFGIKATKIKVMISASDRFGTIAEESTAINIADDVPGARRAGASLWIDNLTLSY